MQRKFIAFLVIAVFSLGLISCTQYSLIRQTPGTKDGYLIRNVNVFTAERERPVLEDMDVYIKSGAIEAVSKDRLDIKGAQVIDGKGRMLLPGLIDFHTHITGGMIIPWGDMTPTMPFNFEGCLYSGVTSIVDMGGKPTAAMNGIAEDIESGGSLGPHLYHCGMGFTGKGAHPIPMMDKVKGTFPWFVRPFFPEIVIQVDSVEDMARLEKHLSLKPDFTKIFLDDLPDGTPKMSPEIVKEIVRRSHARDIPVVIHVGRNEDVRVAIDSGADGIAHDVYKEPLDGGLAKELALKKMFVTPTVYVFHNLNLFVNEKDYTHYTRLEWETMHPSGAKALKNPKPYIIHEGDPFGKYYKNFKDAYASVLHPNIRVLKDAGVTIIAGTDSPNLAIASGSSLHIELEHLVEGGLTPVEALISATLTPAKILKEVFHRDVDFGTIEKGKAADLLLVNGDPTKNIRDTQNIVEVFYRGNRLDRAQKTNP